MCQMRALKEYKERTGDSIDFITHIYLHWIVANHTDIFNKITFTDGPSINPVNDPVMAKGYDGIIEFRCDWGKAVSVGILRSWTETTLGFTPSTDKPYFNLTEEEKITTATQFQLMKNPPNRIGFRKAIIVNPEAVSDEKRSLLKEDWNKFLDLFPQDVLMIYPCPVNRPYDPFMFTPRQNLLVLPGYPLGMMGALMEQVDLIVAVHSGFIMMAHAVNSKRIVHINLLEASGENILKIPNGENVYYQSNRQILWDQLKVILDRNLL